MVYKLIFIEEVVLQGVVRAMDTVQSVINDDLGLGNIDKFMVAGESKRGWTTWMTAPIDDRVVAMAPVVMSSLKMQEVSITITPYIYITYLLSMSHHYTLVLITGGGLLYY